MPYARKLTEVYSAIHKGVKYIEVGTLLYRGGRRHLGTKFNAREGFVWLSTSLEGALDYTKFDYDNQPKFRYVYRTKSPSRLMLAEVRTMLPIREVLQRHEMPRGFHEWQRENMVSLASETADQDFDGVYLANEQGKDEVLFDNREGRLSDFDLLVDNIEYGTFRHACLKRWA